MSRRRFRLKPAGYAVLGILALIVVLCIYAIARAIGGGSAKASPTPILVDGATPTPEGGVAPTPTFVPAATDTPIPSETPTPVTYTQTPAVYTQTPNSATATPSSSIRKPTSSEKKNAEKGVLTGDDINLRAGPSTDYKSLGKYKKGDSLVVYATDGDFYFVKMGDDDKIGFMSKKYVQIAAAATIPADVPTDSVGGKVTAGTVALRKGPNKTDTAITELHAGDIVYVYYETNEFYYVEVASSGKKGFAFAAYISASGTVPKK